MKTFSFTIIAAGIAAFVLIAGCGDSLSKRVEKLKESGQTDQQAKAKADDDAKVDYMDEWQDFRSDAEQQIAANAKVLENLKTKAAASNDEFRAKMSASVESLAQKNQGLKEQLNGYRDEGKLNWDAFKRDFSRELDGLDKALKDLKASSTK